VALEASALSGIADAEYMRGRFHSAFGRFTECVELSRAHGLGRTEAANLSMVAITGLWTTSPAMALDRALEAVEATRRIGHGRAEMVAHHAAFLCYKSRAELGPARMHAEQAIDIAHRLGAKRFEAEGLLFRAEIEFAEGERERAVTDAHAAVEMSRKFGFAYMGPSMLGGLALVSDDEAEWRAALAEGEALLGKGSVSHNHVFYRTYAIDACLRRGEHDEAERHAEALAAYTLPEELPVAELFVGRGRVLARLGRGEKSAELAAELDRLIGLGEASMQHQAAKALREARATLRAG